MMKNQEDKLIATGVRMARAAHRWTQSELASRAGVSTVTVNKMEKGHAVRYSTLEGVARAFGMKVSALLELGRSGATREQEPARQAAGD